MKDLQIHFTENIFQEHDKLREEWNLYKLATLVESTDEELSEPLRTMVGELLAYLIEMFSIEIPDISGPPEAVLRRISRDINISRLLKGRGLMRLYLFVKSEVEQEPGYPVMAYQLINDPYTEEPFKNQKEFIGWFCRDAGVSRSWVFYMVAAIDKLMKGLDFSLEDAYKIILARPSIIRDTLNDVATWGRGGNLESIEPAVAKRIVEQTMRDSPEEQEELEQIIEGGDPDEINEAMKEPLRRLVEEVASHDSVHDAREMINEEILKNPRIIYLWDAEADGLIIRMEPNIIDEKGNEYAAIPQSVTLLPDTLTRLPQAIKKDLLDRLPVRNKEEAYD